MYLPEEQLAAWKNGTTAQRRAGASQAAFAAREIVMQSHPSPCVSSALFTFGHGRL